MALLGFYFCFYSSIICYSLVNLTRWIVVIQSGYNVLYVIFNTREFHKMSNPIKRREIQNSFFFNPLILFKEMKYYLCLI